MVKQTLSLLRNAAATVAPLGRTLLAVALACWFLGVRWGWQELLIVSGTLLALLFLSIPFTVGRLHLRSSIRVEPSRVVVGERAAGALVLENEGRRTAHAFRVELPVGKVLAVYSVSRLPAGGEVEELFVVPTNRRAIIPVGPLTTVQGDPLGLLRRKRTWSDHYEIYVHPVTTGLSTIAAGVLRDIEGQTTSALSASDVAFHTLRDYVPGDDRRHVHWKSSAKSGRLLVKQYNDTRRSNVAVLLSTDRSEYVDDDEFELAVSCAASVALQARRDDQTLTVLAGAVPVPAIHPKAMLDRFSGVEAGRKGGVAQTLAFVRHAAPDASVVVLCTGSVPALADVRAAARHVPANAATVVVRASLGDRASYRVIGSTRLVTVPSLGELNRGLEAVL